MSTPYIVKGVDNGIYPRREIADLMTDEFQFSLFIQAMSHLQIKGYQPDAASWQQMGGIHGLPYTRWSGDPKGPADPEPGQGWEGYCYHASILFPPWHRVLIMLVEQAVGQEAQAIASAICDKPEVSAAEKTQWTDAAAQLRFPFWDWSQPQVADDGIPEIFVVPSLPVRGPGNIKITLDNPLMCFKFNEIPAGAKNEIIGDAHFNFADWTRTYRWATDGANPQDNITALNLALKEGGTIGGSGGMVVRPQEQTRQKLGRVFSFPATAEKELWPTYWDYFSNTAPQADPPAEAATIASLEEPHNWFHLSLGGVGHMSSNDFAGFDPIFFFHHCNIDRLYALWEYVYPDYWMGQGFYGSKGLEQFNNPDGTFQEAPGTSISEDSQLPPFRNTTSNYWVTSEVRGLQPGQGRNKYYTYTPLEITVKGSGSEPSKTVVIDVNKPATLEQRQEYIAALQQLYEPDPQEQSRSDTAAPPIFKSSLSTNSIPNTHKKVDGYRDFVVTGDVPQFAFRGSFRLKLYLDGQHVDNISVLNRLNHETCENCVSRIASGNARVRGVMTLPHKHVVRLLQRYGKNTAQTTDDEVIDLLLKHISAHIVNPIGTALAQASHGLSTTTMQSGHQALKAEYHPVLRLHSSRVFVAGPNVHLPRRYEGWVHHGDVLKGEWRSM